MQSQNPQRPRLSSAPFRIWASSLRPSAIAEPLEQRFCFSSLFGPPLPGFTLGSFPVNLAVGDFNGDGKNDLAVGVLSSSSGASSESDVDVYLGDGVGGFNAEPVVTPAAGSPFLDAVGDFTGDGKLDIPVVDDHGNLTLYKGEGGGAFGAALSQTRRTLNLTPTTTGHSPSGTPQAGTSSTTAPAASSPPTTPTAVCTRPLTRHNWTSTSAATRGSTLPR
jgi:hypothetical protein